MLEDIKKKMLNIYIIEINFSCKWYMPIRRTRMIVGERYIKKHHDDNAKMK